MRTVRGLVIAFGAFAASFALHVVGGATDQGWLFAIAVGLIYLTAVGFPVIAYRASGSPAAWKPVVLAGAVLGFVLTASALRAANDRTFAAWQIPVAVLMVAGVSGGLLALLSMRGRGTLRPVAGE